METPIAVEKSLEGLSEEDRKWVEEQLAFVPCPDEGYTDAQFAADVAKSGEVLEARAKAARLALARGNAKKMFG